MPYAFANGAGTEADPYQVWTAEDLDGVRDYLDAHFIQMADIDLSGYSNWEPIGSSSVKFSGIYDGNGHEVNGLTINRTGTSHSGLFRHLKNATVKNLGVININMSGLDYVGGLAGYISYGSKISNCYVTGEIAGSYLVGGLVGDSYINCAISDCYSMCKVSGSSIWIGGLIGRNNSDSSTRLSTVIRCYSINLVTGYNSVGGLVGASDLRLSEVTSSYYDSELSGCSDTGKGVPKTTAEMKQQSTYEGWDFDTVWGIDPAINDGYPYLRVFEHEAPIIDDVIPSYPPASYIKLQFQAGDSELYDMGIFYTDKTRYRVGDPGARVDARNSIGKYLRDQSFDERNNYSVMRLDDLLEKILIGAGITDYYVAANATQLGMQFAPNRLILDGINDVLAYAPGWIVREEVTGRVVIGPKDDPEFTQPSRYTFQRDRDIFSREQIKDDQRIYGRVCVHTTDFVVKVYRAVTSALGWLPPAQKTYYQVVPDGTTSQEAAALATELADAMADSGEVETFVCPFRPQIIPGDEAEILDSDGATFLGVITQVTHSFGAQGFFSEIVVDSGGRIGKTKFKDIVNALQPLPASKRL